MEALSQDRLQLVHPKLASLVQQLDARLIPQGIHLRVVQGLRTMAEQQALWEQGRTAPGSIVTNARPGDSWHNYGAAVDLIPGLRGTPQWEPNWDENHPDFKAMIRCGIGLGLVSGSTWESFKDYPHFQLAGLPVTPTQAMRVYLVAHGMTEFWQEYIR